MKTPITLPRALWRGFTMRCPNCGRGHLFRRFLKVVDRCGICGEDYTPQRADDFPAYLVIIVVGHVVVPALLAVEIAFAPPAWLQLLIWVPVTGLSALALLQPTKGTIVGLQWHSGMHGFEVSKRRRDKGAADGEACLIEVPIQSGTILGRAAELRSDNDQMVGSSRAISTHIRRCESMKRS